MFHDTASKHLHKEEGVVPRRKRSKTPNEVKTIENVNKNPVFYRDKSQDKRRPSSYKLQDHVYE